MVVLACVGRRQPTKVCQVMELCRRTYKAVSPKASAADARDYDERCDQHDKYGTLLTEL